MAMADNPELRVARRLASQALADVFRALGGNRWRNNRGWLRQGTDVKTWHGVTLHEGTLVSLNLISNDLEGIIPSTISNLVTLTELNLSYNFGVVGVIPREVGSMTSLTVLHIYGAGIHGSIPESFSLLHNLEELWLNGNRLSGTIPEGLGRLPRLRELYLNANELVGGIPSSFGKLTRLEGLNLGWNKLSGDFPASLGNMVNLRLLVLEGNEFFEEIPPAEQGAELREWLACKSAALAALPEQVSLEPKETGHAKDSSLPDNTKRKEDSLEPPVCGQASNKVYSALECKPITTGMEIKSRSADAECKPITTGVGIKSRSTDAECKPVTTDMEIKWRSTDAECKPITTGVGIKSRSTDAECKPITTGVDIKSRSTDAECKPITTGVGIKSRSTDVECKPITTGVGIKSRSNHAECKSMTTDAECKPMTTELGSRSSPTLQEVLRDETGPPFNLDALKAFAAEQMMEENIEFWVEVERFKTVDEGRYQQAAANVCNRYISPGAPMEINLSGDVRTATLARVRSLQNQAKTVDSVGVDGKGGLLDRTIFDKAQRQIYHLTDTDAFPRFLHYITSAMQDGQGSVHDAAYASL